MIIEEFFQTLAKLSTPIFVITSMTGLGLSLTVSEILTPLKDGKLVFRVLLANFVLVPFLGFLLTRIVSLDRSLSAGLLLLACASGAPFLTKLMQLAKGDAGLGLGMMVLLMVTTIVFSNAGIRQNSFSSQVRSIELKNACSIGRCSVINAGL